MREGEAARPRRFGTARRHGLVFVYAAVFGMAAYGIVRLMILVSSKLGLPF
ncbi:MAG: hypothetical protein HQ495_01295 [Alphaproteobacteria bacterium]|nr:hypothetical protein [Alphaproteobacteria bacterium]